ncbi:MAG: DNA repair protein RecO C-terminal domain-containing protein [Treponema sp.]|nr:DNA repair protein RecO C-terminal domain-containing protein [Treponema sp.]
MSRTAVYSALVLRSRPSGESNNEVTLLTAEEGIIKTTVFGGPKNKLRAHSAPYNSGQVWIYRDPAKDYGKLSDFDVQSWRPGLRELYERTMAASAAAETILTTHGGGGDWGTALQLASSTLDALESANEELCSRLLIHFLWRWTKFLGIQPYLENCASCSMGGDASLWYNSRESIVLCANCVTMNREQTTINNETRAGSSGLLKLNPGCRKWFIATEQIEPSLLYRYSMDNKSFNEAKSLVTSVIAGTLGKRLASWDW